jgi:NADH dehydrogenase [ubiquinone] 1 alpha subcomplex assembly factor 6
MSNNGSIGRLEQSTSGRRARIAEQSKGDIAEFVRRNDPERYLTALFAPADRRDAVLSLFAFNYEIAKTREVVTEPTLGRIRLQWWREGIEQVFAGGAVRSHEVLTPLAAAVRKHELDRQEIERMIDAREQDLEADPPATRAALDAYCESTSGALQSLVLAVLGVGGEVEREAARAAGTAYALAGLIRAIPFHARAKRQFIPRELAEAEHLDLRELFELHPSRALAAIAERLAMAAWDRLARARSVRAKVSRTALPALLPASLAGRHLNRLRRARYDVFNPRFARPNTQAAMVLTLAAITGRY